MKHTKTVVVTGGHVTPAIAVIDALNPEVPVVFFGRKYAMEGSKIVSAEYRLITGKGIRFISITAGRLQRHLTWMTVPSLFKIPVGCIQALWYCLRLRPALIVSFGGYVALPTVLVAWLCRIPVITHEQTLVPGLANRIIARVATRVCVSFPETLALFPKGKAVLTGLPMREELFTAPKKSPFSLDLSGHPLLYITGGGTGAQSLNRIVYPILSTLLHTYTIIHQVGETSLIEAQKIRTALGDEYKRRYIIRPYLPMPEVSWVLSHASLVLTRSGANTVVELAVLGKVSLLIPLPWSAGGEQQQNADWLQRGGGAVVVSQSTLTPYRLRKEIEAVWAQIPELQQRASGFAKKVPRNGTRRMLREIDNILTPT